VRTRKGIIGYTELGKPIPYVYKGKGKGRAGFVFGATHAREWITADLISRMIDDYDGEKGIFFVPCVNIDGVRLAKEFEAFSLWKANGRGVDINVNFDADWGTGEGNVRHIAPSGYIGERPESESETRALTNFTRVVRPDVALSYHSKGEVIYYGYKGKYPCRPLAEKISLSTGYPLEDSFGSAGGYKDWYTENFDGLALTIEVGRDECEHPIGLEHLDEIYKQNKEVLRIVNKCMMRNICD
jgi:g-D-glutamyl-meso-diaminopimelate peptidase